MGGSVKYDLELQALRNRGKVFSYYFPVSDWIAGWARTLDLGAQFSDNSDGLTSVEIDRLAALADYAALSSDFWAAFDETENPLQLACEAEHSLRMAKEYRLRMMEVAVEAMMAEKRLRSDRKSKTTERTKDDLGWVPARAR